VGTDIRNAHPWRDNAPQPVDRQRLILVADIVRDEGRRDLQDQAVCADADGTLRAGDTEEAAPPNPGEHPDRSEPPKADTGEQTVHPLGGEVGAAREVHRVPLAPAAACR